MRPASALRDWYQRNRILAWICGVIAVNQLGFGGIVPVVPLYAESFGVSKVLIGLTITAYGLARFIAGVPAGKIADLFGRRWTLALGGAITVFGNLICGFADTYTAFLIGRFVAGLGGCMVLTGGQIILTDITTPATRGRMMAIYQSVFLFAVGFGPLPGGYLAQHGGLAFPFFVYSVVGSIVALLALFRVPETREMGMRRHAADGAPQMSFGAQVAILMRHPAFLMVSLVSFGAFFARTGALFNLVPQRAENSMGLSTGQIGFGLAAISIVSLLVAYPSGVVVDRYGRKSVIVPSMLISAVALTSFAFAPDFAWFIVACLGWAFASGIASAAPGAYAADVSPPGMNAAAMGTYRMLADSGYVIGPLLLGWLADVLGTSSALIFASGLLLVTGLAFALFAPESYKDGVMHAQPKKVAAD